MLISLLIFTLMFFLYTIRYAATYVTFHTLMFHAAILRFFFRRRRFATPLIRFFSPLRYGHAAEAAGFYDIFAD